MGPSGKSGMSGLDSRGAVAGIGGWSSFGVLAVAVALIVGVILLSGGPLGFTGHSILSGVPSTFSFAPPTPENGSMVIARSVVINVSSDDQIVMAVLSWNGRNISMVSSGNAAWAMLNASGAVDFQVHGTGPSGLMSSTESRSILVGFVNWSVPLSLNISEDSRFDIDLWPLLVSSVDRSNLSYSISQDRTDRLSCGVSSSRFLNCSSVPDASGSTIVGVAADDMVASAQWSVNLTLLPANDPPRLVGGVPDKSLSVNKRWEVAVSSFFYDPDSANLSFSIQPGVPIPVESFGDGLLRFSPNASSVGVYTLTFFANDSLNATPSNPFRLEVVANRPPQVVTRLQELILNATNAYKLRFYQVFRDPEGDELNFTFQNMTLAKITRDGNNLYIMPRVNRSGTENLVVSASDGLSSTSFSLPVTIILKEGNASGAPAASVGEDGSEGQGSSPGTPSAAPGVSASVPSDLSGKPVPPGSAVPSSDALDDSSAGSPQSGMAASGGDIPSKDAPPPALTPAPSLLRAMPELVFNTTGGNVSIDLSQYWSDPSGSGLEFLIEPKKNLVTRINEKRVAIISLKSPAEAASNETIKVIAKDKAGNVVSGSFSVRVPASMVAHNDAIDMILQGAILLLVVAAVGGLLFRHVGPLVVSLRSGLSGRGSASSGIVSSGGPEVSDASARKDSASWPDMLSGRSVLPEFSDLLAEVVSKKGVDAPKELRSEAIRLRESLAVVRVIMESAGDPLISSAIDREVEKLHKAVQIMYGSGPLKRDDLRRVLLYVKEAGVCLSQIRELSNESLISQELSREITRIEATAKSIEVKVVYLLSRRGD